MAGSARASRNPLNKAFTPSCGMCSAMTFMSRIKPTACCTHTATAAYATHTRIDSLPHPIRVMSTAIQRITACPFKRLMTSGNGMSGKGRL